MTPYRDRSEAGEFEPKTAPAQPKDVKFTDKKFLEKTGGSASGLDAARQAERKARLKG